MARTTNHQWKAVLASADHVEITHPYSGEVIRPLSHPELTTLLDSLSFDEMGEPLDCLRAGSVVFHVGNRVIRIFAYFDGEGWEIHDSNSEEISVFVDRNQSLCLWFANQE